jgi:hypothetical protein
VANAALPLDAARLSEERPMFALPTSGEDGRWKRTKLQWVLPSSGHIVSWIKGLVSELDAQKEKEEERRILALKEGAYSLSEVFENDLESAKIYVTVPSMRPGDKSIGTVLLTLRDGHLTPQRVEGKIARQVLPAIHARVRILTSEVKKEKPNLQRGRNNDETEAARFLHEVLYRTYVRIRAELDRKQKSKALKERATCSEAEFLGAASLPGLFLLELGKWSVGSQTAYGICALIERREDGQVRVADTTDAFRHLFRDCLEFQLESSANYPLADMMRIVRKRYLDRSSSGHVEKPSDHVMADVLTDEVSEEGVEA